MLLNVIMLFAYFSTPLKNKRTLIEIKRHVDENLCKKSNNSNSEFGPTCNVELVCAARYLDLLFPHRHCVALAWLKNIFIMSEFLFYRRSTTQAKLRKPIFNFLKNSFLVEQSQVGFKVKIFQIRLSRSTETFIVLGIDSNFFPSSLHSFRHGSLPAWTMSL